MTGCVFGDCLVWPRRTGSVLAVNKCCHSVPPRNHWYSFNDVLPEDVRNHNRMCGLGHSCWGDTALVDTGTTSVFNQIPCLNDRFVRFYYTVPQDLGKTITIFGIDSNGQTITQERDDGTWQEGFVLTLTTPYVQTPFLVRRIDRVIKDATQGVVRGFQFDGKIQYDLAVYDGSETLPEYRQDRISGGCHTTNTGCCTSQVTALVKLKFIPVVNDDDLVLIDNLDALAIGMQALNQSDAYDHAGAEAAMARAVHTLNLDLRDKLPIDQTPVRVHYQGTAHLSRKRVGRVI